MSEFRVSLAHAIRPIHRVCWGPLQNKSTYTPLGPVGHSPLLKQTPSAHDPFRFPTVGIILPDPEAKSSCCQGQGPQEDVGPACHTSEIRKYA